jgi:hypothetical protein
MTFDSADAPKQTRRAVAGHRYARLETFAEAELSDRVFLHEVAGQGGTRMLNRLLESITNLREW